MGEEGKEMEKYQNCRLPPFVYLGPHVHIAEGMPGMPAPSLHLYLGESSTIWSAEVRVYL